MADFGLSEPLGESLDTQHARRQLVQQLAEWFVIVMAFLVPIIVVPVGERIGMSDPLLPALAVLLVFSRYRGRIDASHWLLLGFLAIAFLSLFQINDHRLQVKSGLKWVRLVGICAPFFLGARMFVDRQLVRRAAWAFFWGGLIAIMISLAVWWLQIPIRDAQQKIWYQGGATELRAGGLVGETTHFGHLTATWMTLVGSCLILVRPVKHWKWVLLVLLGVGGFAIFAASSRSAIVNLAGTAGGIWAAARYRPRSLSNSVIAGLVLAMLLVLGFTALQIAGRSRALPPTSRIAKQIDRFLPSESNSVNRFSSGRIDSWQRYLRIAGNHVVLGCGYKNSPSLIPGRVPDNSVLSTLLETGVLGLAAMTAFALVLMISLGKQGISGNHYALVLAGVWLGQLMQALLGDIYTLWLSMPVLYLITGLVLQLGPEPDAFGSDSDAQSEF